MPLRFKRFERIRSHFAFRFTKLGVVVLALAFYYLQAARANLRSFAEWSIPPRVAVFLFFTGFVLVGWVGPILIGLGAVDLLGAVWTSWALRAEK